MNQALIERIQQLFEERIAKKTGWGKNEVVMELKLSVNQACLEIIDKRENPAGGQLPG